MNDPQQAAGYHKNATEVSQRRHPQMFLSGNQFRIRLDSRLKHAGMTVFEKKSP